MKVTAKLNNLRISPQKARIVANVLKGLDANNAQTQAESIVKKASFPIEKLIKSAIANAENNFGLDKDNLYIYDIQVGESKKLKRWMPRAFGRASAIIKRSSHIALVLEEKIEGKNRKTREQLEKERKTREEAKRKLQEEAVEAEKEKNKKKQEGVSSEVKFKKESYDGSGSKKAGKDGWVKKIFRRKSV